MEIQASREPWQLFLDQPREETRSNRQCSVVEIVMRVVHRAAANPTGIADIYKGARAGFKHVGKILCRRNETSIPIDMCLADEISRSVGNDFRLGRIIDERRPQRRRQRLRQRGVPRG